MKQFLLPVVCLAFLALCHSVQAQTGQLVEQDDVQSWNDLQVTVPLSKKLDVFGQATFRFGQDISRVNDRRLAFGFVWKPHKLLSVSPFYWNITMRNSRGLFRQEQRLNLRITYRFPFKSKVFGLSHRSWIERRLRQPQDSWRYRPSLTFERDIKNIIPAAKLYFTEEVFYDSILKKFSRNRFTAGVTKTLTKQLSLDVYYMRQNDGFSRRGDLHVIGTSFKVRF